VLAPDAAAVVRTVNETVEWLRARTGCASAGEALARAGVRGFTVCPPTGADLGQDRIRGALEEVLALGHPVALYQLPQVTRNELAPGTATALAARFPNYFLLKDSSGADRLAESGFRDVFLVRGAEGGYARHLRGGGGRYDGLLLSTANCFARPLAEIVDLVGRGARAAAEAISARLEDAAAAVFAAAAGVGHGNPFTNANKAMDHVLAHGPDAAGVPPPRLHSGVRLPAALIAAARAALDRAGLTPARGYLGG